MDEKKLTLLWFVITIEVQKVVIIHQVQTPIRSLSK